MYALANSPQAFRPVVDRIHARHDRQKYLRRTKIAGRLLTPNVLFAGLQGEPVGRFTRDILGHPDDAARHLPFECLSRRKKRSVRASKSEWNAKSLAGP